MPELLDKVRKSTLHVLPAQVLIKVLGLFYVVILARGLSVDTYGVYNFVIGALLVFSYVCNLGLGSSLQRFLPEYAKLEKFSLVLRTIAFAHAFRFILALITLVIANLTFDVWGPKFHIETRHTEFVIFSIGAFILFQIEYLQIEFNSLFHHWITSVVQVFYTIMKFILVVISIYMGLDLAGVLAAEAIAYLMGLVIAVYFFFSKIYNPYRKELARNGESVEFKRIGRYSGYNALVMPGGILYSNSMDYFIIAAMANPFELGLYALASRVSKMLVSVMPQNVLQSVIRPAIYHHYYSVENRQEELKKMFRSLVLLVTVFLFPSIALVVVTAPAIIEYVFGVEYIAATTVFLILVCFNIFTVLEFSSDMILQAIEKVEARAYAQIFAVYNVIAAILLMPEYGILGVSLATGSALMFKCLFFFYMARRYAGVTLDWVAMFKITLNSVVAGFIAYFIISVQSSALFLALSLILGVTAYIVMTGINNPMSYKEKQIVNTFIKRRLFNV